MLQKLAVVIGERAGALQSIGHDVLVLPVDLCVLVFGLTDLLLIVHHLVAVAPVGIDDGKDKDGERHDRADADRKEQEAALAPGGFGLLLQYVVVVLGIVFCQCLARLGLIDGVLQEFGPLQVQHGFSGSGGFRGAVESLARVQFIIFIALLQEEHGGLQVALSSLGVLALTLQDVAQLVLADAPGVVVPGLVEEGDGLLERTACLAGLGEAHLCACQLREADADACAVAREAFRLEGFLGIFQRLLLVVERAIELRCGAEEDGPPREVVGEAVGSNGFADVLLGLAGLACSCEDAGDAVERGAEAVQVARLLVQEVAVMECLGRFVVCAHAEVGSPEQAIDVAAGGVVHHGALRGTGQQVDGFLITALTV